MTELRKNKIKVLPPDINLSTDQYVFSDGNVICPLLAIKSIGRQSLIKILENRNEQGPFKDYQDFKRRMKKEINDKNVEMLIHAGALNAFGLTHHTMISSKQIDQAGYELYVTDFTMPNLPEYSFSELADFEKEALGYNLVYHPIAMYENEIMKYRLKSVQDILDGKEGFVLGMIKKKKVIKTKQGKPMAFIQIDDGVNELEATFFTDTYQKYESYLTQDVQIFKINKNNYRGDISFVIDRIMSLADLEKGDKIK